MTKCIFVLDVNDYCPEIKALTGPLLKAYAHKIGAYICRITERKFPEWPVTYEKLQIYRLAKELDYDWNIYIDLDVLIHPDMYDLTEQMPDLNTVAHNGRDMAGFRWKYDDYFTRDGRNIGSCNWLAIASRRCLDLWRPIEDLTPAQAISNIYPIVEELNYREDDGSPMCQASHLIDDYALSRNIARFGLKYTTVIEMNQRLGANPQGFFVHNYAWTRKQKVENMKKALESWKMPATLLLSEPPSKAKVYETIEYNGNPTIVFDFEEVKEVKEVKV